jgi:hypothetical protein
MSVIGSNILAGASGQGGEYTIEESLRFNASQSSYLSWTPASAGNRKTWTWSGWVKRGALSSNQRIFEGFSDSSNFASIVFGSSDNLQVVFLSGGSAVYNVITSQVFRDVSSWYHIFVVVDTTQATSSNRIKVYVNGEQVTSFGTATYGSQNFDTQINNTVSHSIGRYLGGSYYLDGYLTEVNFIDGQALDPSSFGEFDSVTGVWKPAKYAGTYGTNGFYLPMQLDNTVEGFNTVTYLGNGSTQKIGGIGFSPDLVWIKRRSTTQDHVLFDSVRGATKWLKSNATEAELTYSNSLVSFDTDGFALGGINETNANGQSYAAWCWDAGSSTVSNTDGSITSSVRANPAYGFSVVTYTGTGSNATVGHGLGTAPSMLIIKNRNASENWAVGHQYLSGAPWDDDMLFLNATNATYTAIPAWGNQSPTSTTFGVGANLLTNGSGNSHVAYCFSEVAGFSKFGSYTGTGATSGNVITCGFKPAMVMVKQTNGVGNWLIWDDVRSVSNTKDDYLIPNSSSQELTNSLVAIDFLSNGFELRTADDDINGSGDSYIYMAFKDTREYAYWLDDSGNNNDWQPNGGITTESTVTDTPTPYADGGNYCTLNPLMPDSVSNTSFSNANLYMTAAANLYNYYGLGTFQVNSGKWYFEASVSTFSSSSVRVGWSKDSGVADADIAVYGESGTSRFYTIEGSTTTGKADITSSTVIGCSIDLDANTVEFFNDSVSQGVASISAGTWLPYGRVYENSGGSIDVAFNFGQRPFAYTPPTGFKPLHTGNLPDSSIVDGSEYFNTVTYTGDGTSSRAITGVGFQPDFVWTKGRNDTWSNYVFDVVRGIPNMIYTNGTAAETSYNVISSFDADGFTVSTTGGGGTNTNAATYVAWNWKANGAGVSNTDGSITSTVSASPTAGFSIVTYTGNGSAGATIGHGLGVAPSMIIVKRRDSTGGGSTSWGTYHKSLGATKAIWLDETSAAGTNTAWNNTSPTSSVFYVGGTSEENGSGTNIVAYCFADVEGYSKFGSYTGNGSSDGVFVYLGFRPAFVMWKRSNSIGDWVVIDSERSTFNVGTKMLYPNLSNAETDVGAIMDFTSNGFKLRFAGGASVNESGGTYIYMAFAENPFKNSLAR